jgi:hypothetical protein
MPIVRYIIWVGTSLLALLLVANWFAPESRPEPIHEAVDKPVIRITSAQEPPERVVIDTNQPTIIPPPLPVESVAPASRSPLQSYASVDPSPTAIEPAKKRPKAIKRREARVAPYEARLSYAPAAARGAPPPPAPSARLSFADIMSGQLVRNLFNLR